MLVQTRGNVNNLQPTHVTPLHELVKSLNLYIQAAVLVVPMRVRIAVGNARIIAASAWPVFASDFERLTAGNMSPETAFLPASCVSDAR